MVRWREKPFVLPVMLSQGGQEASVASEKVLTIGENDLVKLLKIKTLTIVPSWDMPFGGLSQPRWRMVARDKGGVYQGN